MIASTLPMQEEALMRRAEFQEDMSVDAIMRTRPETIAIFLRNHMHCVGCVLAPFHTIGYAALEHDLDADALTLQITEIFSRPAG